MTNVYSKAKRAEIKIDRLIGQIKGDTDGPTILFTAGIHGNEPAGVFALQNVLETLCSQKTTIHGNFYAIAGNLNALEAGIRYHEEDLNRMWTAERLKKINENVNLTGKEEIQQQEIYNTISKILDEENGPFYFIDLHTTSSKTKPFITVNDNLLNRKFTKQYPVPLLLGIEEYLDGTLLSYVNEKGFVAFGFESGQHDEILSIENHIAFIYLSLLFAGLLEKTSNHYIPSFKQLAATTKDLAATYEIIYHYKLNSDEVFEVIPGFKNFEIIKKGQRLAISNGHDVLASIGGSIFMPLYQKSGDDGFFVIKPVANIFLYLSIILRRIHLDQFLTILPGVSWMSKTKDALKINLKIARFFAKKFFHLLGYRNRQLNSRYLIAWNREAKSRKEDYKNAKWNN